MTAVDSQGCGPLGHFVRAFYDARRAAGCAGDPNPLHRFIAADVRWREPDVGVHMGLLEGRDAVLDMIRRALDTTGGSFELRVGLHRRDIHPCRRVGRMERSQGRASNRGPRAGGLRSGRGAYRGRVVSSGGHRR